MEEVANTDVSTKRLRDEEEEDQSEHRASFADRVKAIYKRREEVEDAKEKKFQAVLKRCGPIPDPAKIGVQWAKSVEDEIISLINMYPFVSSCKVTLGETHAFGEIYAFVDLPEKARFPVACPEYSLDVYLVDEERSLESRFEQFSRDHWKSIKQNFWAYLRRMEGADVNYCDAESSNISWISLLPMKVKIIK